MEREDSLHRAAQAAFVAAFVGARILDRDVQVGAQVAWAWIAELVDGRLCAVMLVPHARDVDAWSAIDGAAQLAEHQLELRRLFGASRRRETLAPLVVVIAESSSSAFRTRMELLRPERVSAFELLRVTSAAHEHVHLSALHAHRARAAVPVSVESDGVQLAAFDPLAALEQRLLRLDPAVAVERESHATVFRVHSHELARVEFGAGRVRASVQDMDEGFELGHESDLDPFAARVVERYLELGCWSGAEGGVASLALSEPLLTEEELAAFRELA